ncbi:MAG: hypothetical protein QXD50_02425 [Desulfurococcaceae archaeon]
MQFKKIAGMIITAISVAILLYAFIATGGVVSGIYATSVAIAGFILVLLGPWLWLGDVPVAIRKFIEAKTGAKVESK